MNENKPKTIKEAFERIERMKALVEQAQTALDTEVYNLRELAGGSTFEYEGSRYQVRTPNTNRKDRKHAPVQHPFIVKLSVTPKQAKAAAKMRKLGLSEQEAQANLAALVSMEGTEEAPIEATPTAEVVPPATVAEAALVREDDTTGTTSSVDGDDEPAVEEEHIGPSPEDIYDDEGLAAACEDDMDDIVIE